MLDLSPEKLLVLAVVALVVLGPNRLPQAARTLGRMIGQLRAMSASFQTEVRDALHEPHEAISSAVAEFRPVADLRPGRMGRTVRRAVVDTLAPGPAAAAGAAGAANNTAETGPSRLPSPGAVPDDPALN